jgi:hypothetical protein
MGMVGRPRYHRHMVEPVVLSPSESSATESSAVRDQGPEQALVAAIQKPLDALGGAAEEAASGMLGGAKLGLLVAANGLIEALNAVDAEFARQHRSTSARRAGPAGIGEHREDPREA